jgi:TolB protein
VALTTGTFTPIPRDAVTPTAEPRPTAVPLLVPMTPGPTPSPTATAPATLPAALEGKILFFSDRSGDNRLYALDPSNGRLSWVTQEWPFAIAQAREGRSSDGRFAAEVQTVTDVTEVDRFGNPSATVSTAVLFIRSIEYQKVRELTTHDRFSYDPAWSPVGDSIVFVARGENDEIYVINADGSNLRRLTSNTWEWDKHPSWSPDGKQIVFWSNRDTGRRQLWIMNADGSNQRLLLSSPYNDWDPIWVK